MKIAASLAGAVAWVCLLTASIATAQTTISTIPVLHWNMDDRPLAFTFPYGWSDNSRLPVATAQAAAGGHGVGGSNAWLLQLDTRPLASDPPLSAGGGMGGEGPVDYARFSSPALADYQISFAVRVSGLAQPQAQTPITLRLFLSAPDDTLDPPDLNPAPDLLLRLDWILPAVGTEWQHDTLSLADATIGTGAISHFQAHHLSIQQLQVQWEIANAADADLWGFDNDNLLVVDDLILERLYESVSPLSIQVVGNQLEIRWTSPSSGTTQLETATAIGGPYTPVPGATSPHPASLSDTARFFRAYWTP
jgi:hypothetical protein